MIIDYIKKKLLNGAFEEMFFENEFKALNDKSGSGLLKLLGIVLLTFLSLGFSLGSLKYLQKRMDNPLTNWIYIFPNQEGQLSKLNNSEPLSILQLRDSLNKVKSDFNIIDISEFSIGRLDFFNRKNKSYYGFQRTLSFEKNEKLLESILNKENLIYKRKNNPENFTKDFDKGKGLVLTEDFIRDLGYEIPENQRKVRLLLYHNQERYPIFIEILAIVKEIPTPKAVTLDFICSNRLYNNYYEEGKNVETGNTHLRIVGTNSNVEQIEQFLGEYYSDKNFVVEASDFSYSIEEEYLKYSIREKEGNSFDKIQMLGKLQQQEELGRFLPYFEWNISKYSTPYEAEPDYLSIVFEDWRKIRNFSQFLDSEFAIKLNIMQVEEKENFSLISTLTKIMAIVLFFLGLVSIFIYVVNLLGNHLRENRSTIGTFKAFGLSNRFLTTLYSKIILAFLSGALVPTLLIGLIIHLLCFFAFRENSFFSFYNHFIFLAALLFMVLTFWFIKKYSIDKILKNTPGDLIYQRDST